MVIQTHIGKKVFLFFFLTLLVLNLKAQQLTGKVSDFKTGKPIKDVTVVISSLRVSTLSDSSGEFVFDDVPDGSYIVDFRHAAYHHESEKINIAKNSSSVINIFLDVKWVKLQEVEIRGSEEERSVFTCNTISKTEIEEKSVHDIGTLLRSMPNISGVRKGGVTLDPVLRGFRYGQLNVQMNSGVKIEGGCPNRMDPTFSHLSSNYITDVKIYNGPYTLRFGPSMGGVIDVITEKPVLFLKPQIHIKAFSGYESNGTGEYGSLSLFGGGTELFFNAFAGYKRFDDYFDGDDKEYNTAYNKYDYSAGVGFRPNKYHEIIMSYGISQGRDVKFAALPMDERSDDTRLFSVDYSIKQVAENIPSIKIKYYNSDVKHKMDNVWRAFSDTVVAVSDIHANNQGGRAELQWTKKDETVFVGADYEAVFKDGDRVKNMILQPGLPVRTENLWSNATIQNLGLFFSYENKALDFDWIVSARIDGNIGDSDDVIIKNPFGTVIYEYGADSINSDYLNFSASAGVSKEFSKELLAKLNIGRGVRSPDMVERFITLLPVGYDKFDYLGNPSLKPEINNQLELSLVYDNEFYGKVSLTGFYSFVENYITGNILPPSQQRPLTKDVLGVKQFYNADKAFLHGFEFRYLSKKYYRCSVDISAAYTNGIIDITEVYDIEDGVAVRVREVENDAIPEIAPFEINIKLRYYNDEIGLSGFVSYRVATEQNHLSEAYFENATPGFSVVDAKIVYRYNKKLSFSGGVKNLFDVAYYEHLNRNIIGSKNDFYERGRSFFMNLKITL